MSMRRVLDEEMVSFVGCGCGRCHDQSPTLRQQSIHCVFVVVVCCVIVVCLFC